MLFNQILLLIGLVASVAVAAPHKLIDARGIEEAHAHLPATPDANIDAAINTNDGLVKRTDPKRGIAFNSAGVVPQFRSPKVSWAYNWASSAGGATPGVEYVPTLWGSKMFSYWKSDAEKAIASGSKHFLGFNEPDHPDQANMSPQDAAAAYKQHLTPFGGRVSLGSPACTNSEDAGMGLSWMRDFFAACAGQCGVDFLATHWYASADQVDYFKQHVNEAISTAKANGIHKVWISEFGALGSEEQQKTFLSQVTPWLDAQPEVARYAYFFAADGYMMTGNSVNALGNQFIGG